ncbi:epoxide hydrolase N-terminal domain-containing protein [Luteimicrobium album]|nr:epoxide hydrolase N-terminal domain-containing protein [Luteimicrobium album]
MDVVPFVVSVAPAELDELRRRVRATRWPDPETGSGWTQGVPLETMRELARYWADEYDWRRLERRLAGLDQLRARVDGLDVDLVHARSPRPDATPLVLTHGWPGSLPRVPRRARPPHAPARRRARLPRRGPLAAGLRVERPADDAGLHLTPPLVDPDLTVGDRTEAERADLAVREAGAEGSAYSAVHATHPQTLGYGLSDSPVGLAAWIVEKVAARSDHDGDLFAVLSRAQALDDVTLYWLTGTAASSTRLYAESIRTVERWMTTPPRPEEVVRVPVGAAVFRDNPRPSRRWAERRYADIRYWGTPERGGHFAAWEQPEIYVRELRASFRAILAD